MVRKYSDLICCDVTFITCSKLNYVYVSNKFFSPVVTKSNANVLSIISVDTDTSHKRSTASCNTHLVNWLVTNQPGLQASTLQHILDFTLFAMTSFIES